MAFRWSAAFSDITSLISFVCTNIYKYIYIDIDVYVLQDPAFISEDICVFDVVSERRNFLKSTFWLADALIFISLFICVQLVLAERKRWTFVPYSIINSCVFLSFLPFNFFIVESRVLLVLWITVFNFYLLTHSLTPCGSNWDKNNSGLSHPSS